jgi:hypothetical protein
MTITPESLLGKASQLELDGNFVAAIALYEEIATSDTEHAAIANNNLKRLRGREQVITDSGHTGDTTTKQVVASPAALPPRPNRKRSVSNGRSIDANWALAGIALLFLLLTPFSDAFILAFVITLVLLLLNLLIVILRRCNCDLCGVRASCEKFPAASDQADNTRPDDVFWLCRRCESVAQSSSTRIGDLIAQSMATRTLAEASAKSGGAGWWVFGAAIAGALFLASQSGRLQITKPPLAVVVSDRESVVGDGKVLVFHNQTGNQITVSMHVERDGKTAGRWAVPVPPNGSSEFGWAQGWPFKRGDKVTLSHAQYRDRGYLFE